jgi:hypothetical protein
MRRDQRALAAQQTEDQGRKLSHGNLLRAAFRRKTKPREL